MVTVRYKGTVVGNGSNQSIPSPSAATQITVAGSPAFSATSPAYQHSFWTNVANVITNLAVNGAVSIYMTTNSSDKTAIEGAVTVIAASNQD